MRHPVTGFTHKHLGWAILLALIAAGPALPCSCVSDRPVQACELFHRDAVIFRGRVIDHNHDRTAGFGQLTLYRFEVLEAFKGLSSTTKQVFIDPASLTSCYTGFYPNRDYLIYTGGAQSTPAAATLLLGRGPRTTKQTPAAWRDRKDLPVFVVGGCSPSRVVAENDADLAYLRSTLTRGPQTTGWIDGRALQNYRSWRMATGYLGLAGATFTFQSSSGVKANATTQADGSFHLSEVPAGTYAVSAESPLLGAGALGPNSIAVPPGGCAVIRASFPTNATIAGKVIGAGGKPVAGIKVVAAALRPDTKFQAVANADAETNANGEYLIPNVPLGKVAVAMNLDHAPTSAMPFDTAFAPGTQDPTAARVFDIHPGQQVTGVTFQLPPSLPFGDLYIDVKWPNGSPALNGARASAQWNGSEAAFETAPKFTNRVTLRLALGRKYEITVDWLDAKPGKFLYVDPAAPQTVEFLQPGQIIELHLKDPRPY